MGLRRIKIHRQCQALVKHEAESPSVRFSPHMPRSCDDPGGTSDTRHVASFGAGLLRATSRRSPLRGSPAGWLSRSARFSITLVNLLPHETLTGLYQPSGVCETPCGLRDSASAPTIPAPPFPVYASIMLFPHPSASKAASGVMLFTRCLPRIANGLANITATLGSFYWLGFETSGLSPDKKRLAWLGAR